MANALCEKPRECHCGHSHNGMGTLMLIEPKRQTQAKRRRMLLSWCHRLREEPVLVLQASHCLRVFKQLCRFLFIAFTLFPQTLKFCDLTYPLKITAKCRCFCSLHKILCFLSKFQLILSRAGSVSANVQIFKLCRRVLLSCIYIGPLQVSTSEFGFTLI